MTETVDACATVTCMAPSDAVNTGVDTQEDTLCEIQGVNLSITLTVLPDLLDRGVDTVLIGM